MDSSAREPQSGESEQSVADEQKRRLCPYLDTINRRVLDFDLIKECSVTLQKHNVYACLICGVFYQGRGKDTHAWTHSLQADHHVFLNLTSGRFYCLPENYEVVDNSLSDIVRALNPQFTPEEIQSMDKNQILSRDQMGSTYCPGFVGMNDLGCSDYITSIIVLLSHVKPLRIFFLNPADYAAVKDPVVQSFGMVMRKIWSRYNFKSSVGIHELAHECSVASKKKFSLGKRLDSSHFLNWFLNHLHNHLSELRKDKKSIVTQTFQGFIHSTISSDEPLPVKRKRPDSEEERPVFVQESDIPFLLLPFDLPPIPLFKEEKGGTVVHTIPFMNLLKKYDGESIKEDVVKGTRNTYRIQSLPDYLFVYFKRFEKNNWYIEKNPTIVNIPLVNLNLSDYIPLSPEFTSLPAWRRIQEMDVSQLLQLMKDYKIERGDGLIDRESILEYLQPLYPGLQAKHTHLYRLIGDVIHDSRDVDTKVRRMRDKDVIQEGTYRALVLSEATNRWLLIQDLFVESIDSMLLPTLESFILLYERVKA